MTRLRFAVRTSSRRVPRTSHLSLDGDPAPRCGATADPPSCGAPKATEDIATKKAVAIRAKLNRRILTLAAPLPGPDGSLFTPSTEKRKHARCKMQTASPRGPFLCSRLAGRHPDHEPASVPLAARLSSTSAWKGQASFLGESRGSTVSRSSPSDFPAGIVGRWWVGGLHPITRQVREDSRPSGSWPARSAPVTLSRSGSARGEIAYRASRDPCGRSGARRP